MSYYYRCKLKVCKIGVTFICCIMTTGMFFMKVQASEKSFDDILLLNKRSKSLLLTNDDSKEDNLSCCLASCMISCFSWLFTSEPFVSPSSLDERDALLTTPNTKIAPFKINISTNVVLKIAMFLNYSDQLRLSHVNTMFRAGINEEFWERQITEQKYLLWNTSISRSRIFFANYFYYKGFGRDPKLPEKVVDRVENVILLPNSKLAKKALDLGFPKGQRNYAQANHKKNMLIIHYPNEESLLEWSSISYNHEIVGPNTPFFLK